MAKDQSKPPLAKLPALSDAQIRLAMQEGTRLALLQAEYNVRAKIRRLKKRGLPLPAGTEEKHGLQTDDSARDWSRRDSDFGNHDRDRIW